MDTIHVVGLSLVALSALLCAWHWQQWRELLAEDSSARLSPQKSPNGEWIPDVHQLRRRTQASALIGLVGMAIAVAEAVPARPWAASIYLFALIIACGFLLWLGLADWAATRQQRNRQAAARIAEELRRQMHSAGSKERP